jgi:hypothetical protein
MDDHAAAGMALRDGLFEDDLGIAEVIGGDAAEDVGGHHAHRGSADDLLGERAGPVAEDDLVVILLDDEEVALDATLEVHEHGGHLLPREFGDDQGGLIGLIDLVADPLANDADEARCLLQADHILEGAGEFADEGAEEDVSLQGDRQVRDDSQGSGGWLAEHGG